jgi:hypothetical protein
MIVVGRRRTRRDVLIGTAFLALIDDACVEASAAGERQGSCRVFQDAALSPTTVGSGFNTTAATGAQFRIVPAQRSGLLRWTPS